MFEPIEVTGGVSPVTGLTFNSSINYPSNSLIYKDDTYVYGCVMGAATADIPINSVIVSGLPKPITGITGIKMPIVITSREAVMGIAAIDSNGNMIVNVATYGATNKWIIINFMYKYA